MLAAIGDLLPDSSRNPFPVIVGTSAGAINAVGLACGALHFSEAVRRLTTVWQGFHTHMVYRSDWPGVIRQATRFIGHSLLGLGRELPVALLDSSPLRELLMRELDFSGIAAAVRHRQLRAVAVTAFGYESGQAVTFYQGRATIDPWFRHRRVGVPTRLQLEHLLASASIPLIFPPVKINREYFGDGAVRQAAPISPALHLGASRVLVRGQRQCPARAQCRTASRVQHAATDPGADRRAHAQQYLHRQPGNRYRAARAPQSDECPGAAGAPSARAGSQSGGGAGDCAKPAAGSDRRAPSARVAQGVAPVPAWPGRDQGGRCRSAQLPVVRARLLQRADRAGVSGRDGTQGRPLPFSRVGRSGAACLNRSIAMR
ncbi:patatin [Ectopseudomonas mendocina DLHK]|nr:patatin [Pseudomonas mendocina DLHK]